jgi:hypothetical protein
MAFDPRSEPCFVCGRELDECGCSLTQDFSALDDALAEFVREEIDEHDDE